MWQFGNMEYECQNWSEIQINIRNSMCPSWVPGVPFLASTDVRDPVCPKLVSCRTPPPPIPFPTPRFKSLSQIGLLLPPNSRRFCAQAHPWCCSFCFCPCECSSTLLLLHPEQCLPHTAAAVPAGVFLLFPSFFSLSVCSEVQHRGFYFLLSFWLGRGQGWPALLGRNEQNYLCTFSS